MSHFSLLLCLLVFLGVPEVDFLFVQRKRQEHHFYYNYISSSQQHFSLLYIFNAMQGKYRRPGIRPPTAGKQELKRRAASEKKGYGESFGVQAE
jgi:hypothetical protein